MKSFPPRLHVLLARDAPTGVVIRRGPSKTVCAIGWDRKRDEFEVGQWMRARIYAKRSDLSPDGKHFIYFAMNGHWSSSTKGAWTAISRAPYLHARVLLAKGDCWNGGGLFVDNKTYWLNDGYGHTVLEDSGELTRGGPPLRGSYGGEDWGVYFLRLLRDGWLMRDDLSIDIQLATTIVFEKTLWHDWTLRKLAHATINRDPGKSVYYDEHDLVGPGRELSRDAWEWADVDRDRLVWCEAGKLYAARITKSSAKREDPLHDVTMLHDFNGMTFEAIAAPYATPKRETKRSKPVPPTKPTKPTKKR